MDPKVSSSYLSGESNIINIFPEEGKALEFFVDDALGQDDLITGPEP